MAKIVNNYVRFVPTEIGLFSNTVTGLVPATGSGSLRFLGSDAEWHALSTTSLSGFEDDMFAYLSTVLVAGTNVTITPDSILGTFTIAASGGGGGGITDGDKGDIVVSSSGSVWLIDTGVISTSKLGGDITAAGIALLDDANAAAQRTTLGLGTLSTQSGTFSGTSSGTNTGDQNLFGTIAVSGQSDVVADSTSDTLTLVAGSNITITTNAGTDSITIASSGGSGVSDGDKGDITVSASGATWTIDNSTITYAKMQNVSATDKVLGRATSGAGVVEEIACTAAGRALIDDADATAQRTTLGLGTLATQSGTFSGTSSGTNTGDQTITLTSDVTGSGTGSFATTIAAGAVSLSKMANMATASILGRNTAGTGSPEVLSASTTKTLLSLNNVENTALTTWTGSTSITTLGTIGTGSWNATNIPLNKGGTGVALTDPGADRLMFWDDSAGAVDWLTLGTNLSITGTTLNASGGGGGGLSDADYGDITVSGTGTVMTIDNDVVTYAKMQNVSATDKLLGRSTAGAGDVEEIACTAAGRAILDDADAAAQRTTLGVLGFSTIAISGQSDVVADSSTDTLTLVAGSNITLTTDAGTDTITIASSGGAGAFDYGLAAIVSGNNFCL